MSEINAIAIPSPPPPPPEPHIGKTKRIILQQSSGSVGGGSTHTEKHTIAGIDRKYFVIALVFVLLVAIGVALIVWYVLLDAAILRFECSRRYDLEGKFGGENYCRTRRYGADCQPLVSWTNGTRGELTSGIITYLQADLEDYSQLTGPDGIVLGAPQVGDRVIYLKTTINDERLDEIAQYCFDNMNLNTEQEAIMESRIVENSGANRKVNEIRISSGNEGSTRVLFQSPNNAPGEYLYLIPTDSMASAQGWLPLDKWRDRCRLE